MKSLITFIVFGVLTFNASAQRPLPSSGSIGSIPSSFFFNDEFAGIYGGPTAQYELGTYSLGAEAKIYGAYHSPLLSLGMYTNYRRLFPSPTHDLPLNSISAGVHFMILDLEFTSYFGSVRPMWYVTPKLVFDAGNFTVSYGYGIGFNKYSLRGKYGHTISLKYAFCWSEL